jgi:glycosyltransferase involved in cell wall biosynthesis
MNRDVPRVAIVHDYLTQRGGAERVVLALHRALPDAPLHTSLYDASATYPEFSNVDVRPSILDRVANLRQHHRLALLLLAPTFSAMEIDADVVVCSSSGWAHGARTAGRKVVYCHAPARWLYQTDAYVARSGPGVQAALAAVRPALVFWDRRAARSADVYLANSTHTRNMIRKAYGIDAEVIFPPAGVNPSGPQSVPPGIDPGYFLCVSRLLVYKHVGVVMEAFRDMPREQLVVVGSGPEARALRAVAPTNVKFLPSVEDEQLRWLYANARALVASSLEDFGLGPVEAATFGIPTVALRHGGYLDTVIEGSTGLFFDAPAPAAVTDGIRRFMATTFHRPTIEAHSRAFDERNFTARIREVVGVR